MSSATVDFNGRKIEVGHKVRRVVTREGMVMTMADREQQPIDTVKGTGIGTFITGAGVSVVCKEFEVIP